MVDNHPVWTLKETPFPVGIVFMTGDNGTSFPERIDLIMLMG